MRGVRGPHAHSTFVVTTESTTFGRAAAADVQILDQRVSRQHARLVIQGEDALLEDLSSHNGTYVHGHQIHRRPLRPGDRIRIGVAEYTFDRVREHVLTSAVFLNKLTTKETLGTTIVRRATPDLLGLPTVEMPASEAAPADSDSGPSKTKRSTRELPAQTVPAPSAPEPAYQVEARQRAIELPAHSTPPTFTAQIQPRPQAPRRPPVPATTRVPTPPSARAHPPGLPEIDVPELGAFLRGTSSPASDPQAQVDPLAQAEVSGYSTVPLDPRSQRMQTPVPVGSVPRPAAPPAPASRVAPPTAASRPKAAPVSAEVDEARDTAQRAVDTVMRLLSLRAQESGGASLRVQDRGRLRKLEQALRESRRGSANRRRWARLPCRLGARIGDDDHPVRLIDIGAGGLCIGGTNLPLAPGDEVTVKVMLGEGRLARVAIFETRVAWVDALEGCFGALFAGPARWELAG